MSEEELYELQSIYEKLLELKTTVDELTEQFQTIMTFLYTYKDYIMQ